MERPFHLLASPLWCLYLADCEEEILVGNENLLPLGSPAASKYFQVRANPVARNSPWSIIWRQAIPPHHARFFWYDINGVPVGNWPAGEMLTPSGLSGGLYHLVLKIDGQMVQQERVVVQ